MKNLNDLLFSVPNASCLICDTPTNPYGKVEFAKNCEERRGTFLPYTGSMVEYNLCPNCGHVFSPAFSHWTHQDFSDHIYNHEYVIADPEYVRARPYHFAREIINIFGTHRDQIKHLDYGGGDGLTTEILNQYGWSSITYDPYGKSNSELPQGKFNLISCFEVFEHHPNPQQMMKEISELLDDQGILLFTTGCYENEVPANDILSFWYISPRNGHISIFTKKSLITLAHRFGLNIAFDFHGMILMFKNMPDFMK